MRFSVVSFIRTSRSYTQKRSQHQKLEFSKPILDLPMSPHLPGDGVARVRGHVLRRPRGEGEPRHQDTRRPAGGVQGHAGVSF